MGRRRSRNGLHAPTTAQLTDYLQQRITPHNTAKPIDAFPTCATELRG
jgi:hypothetical protein